MKKIYSLLVLSFISWSVGNAQVNYGSCQNVTSGSPCFFGLYGFWIESVSFGTLNFSGGDCSGDGSDNGHQDKYNTVSGTVTAGSSYTLTIGIGNFLGDNWLVAWVDWNNDGDFTDPGEQLMTPYNLPNLGGMSAVVPNVQVPSSATVGEHRMRVRSDGSNPGSNPNPCATTGSYGDTKDFKIIVQGGGACANVGGTAVATPPAVCAGSSSTMTLSGSNGTVQWQESADVNSWGNVTGGSGANSSTYITAALTTPTYFRAVLSEPGCTDANSVHAYVTVNPLFTPTISISVSPSATVCEGEAISFTASVTGVGASPGYNWKVNGNQTSTSTVFTTTSLNDGDVVHCELVSDLPCASGHALSDSITVQFVPAPVVTLSLTSNLVCAGSGAITLEGGSPAGGTWSGTGVTDSSFDASQATGTYQITYTYSNGTCSASATDDLEISICSNLAEAAVGHNVSAFPNPVHSATMLISNHSAEGVIILGMNGQMINRIMKPVQARVPYPLDLGEVPPGIYLLQLIGIESQSRYRIAVY